MKLLILSSNNGEGHNSAAKALMEQAEERGISAIIADTLMFDSPRRSERIKKIHINSALYNPRIFKTGERIAERMANGPYQSAIYYESAGFADRIAKFCSINGVDTVVATHVFAAEAMSYLRNWGMPFKGYFVATDYCYTTFVSDTCLDAYFVPHKDIVADYEKKAPKRLYIPSGIPVSENKIIKTDKRIARERLGLPQDVPILMMMTGSMGFGNVKELTERLLPMMPKDTAIVALCGTNDELRAELEKKYGGKCRMFATGYTTRVSEYMDAADVLISKPGGLSSTEAAVKEIALVHMSPLPGWEEENVRFFVKHGLSLSGRNAAENAAAAVKLLSSEAEREHMHSCQRQEINKYAARDIIEYITTH